MIVEPFSAAYYLVSDINLVYFRLQEGESPACSHDVFDDLRAEVGLPVIAKTPGREFELRPASWVPDGTVVVEKPTTGHEVDSLFVRRPSLRKRLLGLL